MIHGQAVPSTLGILLDHYYRFTLIDLPAFLGGQVEHNDIPSFAERKLSYCI